jgi:hypothetical protein
MWVVKENLSLTVQWLWHLNEPEPLNYSVIKVHSLVLTTTTIAMASGGCWRQARTSELIDHLRAHYGGQSQGSGNHQRQQTALCRYYDTCVHLNVSLYSKVAH